MNLIIERLWGLSVLAVIVSSASPCGRFPVDARNRRGAGVTQHHIRITDERRLIIRMTSVADSVAAARDFLLAPHPSEYVSLTATSGCIDSAPPCLILLESTNFRVDTPATNESVYVGLRPDSDIWKSMARVEISLPNMRMTLVQTPYPDACYSAVRTANDLAWQIRTPSTDAQALSTYDVLVLNRTHYAVPSTADTRFNNRPVPFAFAMGCSFSGFLMALIGDGMFTPGRPWRPWLNTILITVFPLVLLNGLNLYHSGLLDNAETWFYVVSSDYWYTFGLYFWTVLPFSWLAALAIVVVSSWQHKSAVLALLIHSQLCITLLGCLTDMRSQAMLVYTVVMILPLFQYYAGWRHSMWNADACSTPVVVQLALALVALSFEMTFGLSVVFCVLESLLRVPTAMAETLAYMSVIAIVSMELTVLGWTLLTVARSK